MNPFSYYRYTPRQPSPLPYWPSGYSDLSKEYCDEDELNIRSQLLMAPPSPESFMLEQFMGLVMNVVGKLMILLC
jgi:hypothetical protein